MPPCSDAAARPLWGHAPHSLPPPDASRSPAGHLKGDADGGTLQLFYLKEEKKTPNHTKNKTNNEKEFRVALLALCAVWSSPRSARRGDQRCARLPGSRPDSGTDSWHQLSTAGPSHLSCCGPWAQTCLWALPAPGSSGNQLFPREPGGPLLGGLQFCRRGGSWLLSVCPFLLVPSVWPNPHDCAWLLQ